MIRRTSHFSGRVQGVGFRYTAQQVARDFAVSGYVRNIADGKVEMVAEGEEAEINRLLQTLNERMEDFIKHRADMDVPATGEFKGFSIRH